VIVGEKSENIFPKITFGEKTFEFKSGEAVFHDSVCVYTRGKVQ
jgi:hypothetical protein